LTNFIIPAANINPIAPETIHTYIIVIEDCSYFGPRIVVAAYKLLRKAVRLWRSDISSCAAVISLLEETGRKMSFEEIVRSVPGLNPVRIFIELHEIDGVLFLDKEPAGLALEEDLIADLRKLL
jgi:hypothetical protein